MLEPGETNAGGRAHAAPAALTVGVCAALIAGNTMGNAGGNVMPVLLTGFSARFGLSDSASGVIAAAQLLATALLTLLLARRAMRPGRVAMARWGLVAAVVGFLLCAWAQDSAMLLLANVLAGAGLGIVFAPAAAGLAATEDGDRASAVTVFGSTVVIALLLVAIPWATDAWGGAAGFVVVAATCVPAWWLVRGLPEGRMPEPGAVAGTPPAWWFLGAVALLAAADQGAWSYAGVLGEQHAHMSSGAVSVVLAISGFAALAGVGASAFVSRRAGRVRTLILILAVEGIAKFLVAACPLASVYTVATIAWQVGYLALLVQVLAVVNAKDASGRWTASAGGALAVGTGLGPAAAGWVLGDLGAPTLGWMLAAATFAGALPLIHLARQVGDQTLENSDLVDGRVVVSASDLLGAQAAQFDGVQE